MKTGRKSITVMQVAGDAQEDVITREEILSAIGTVTTIDYNSFLKNRNLKPHLF